MTSKTETAAANSNADQSVLVATVASNTEFAEAHGVYKATCRGPREELREQYLALTAKAAAMVSRGECADAELAEAESMLEEKWEEEFENLVTIPGKNLALDTILAGSAYTVVGPYIGLINSTASSSTTADTMASHAAWLEVGGANAPTYTAPRKTAAWSAASAGSKALSSALTFAMTSAGTVGGCFLVMGSGALSTIDNAAGTLYSAGAFTGGSKTVSSGDSITVSYTASM